MRHVRSDPSPAGLMPEQLLRPVVETSLLRCRQHLLHPPPSPPSALFPRAGSDLMPPEPGMPLYGLCTAIAAYTAYNITMGPEFKAHGKWVWFTQNFWMLKTVSRSRPARPTDALLTESPPTPCHCRREDSVRIIQPPKSQTLQTPNPLPQAPRPPCPHSRCGTTSACPSSFPRSSRMPRLRRGLSSLSPLAPTGSTHFSGFAWKASWTKSSRLCTDECTPSRRR